MQRVWVVDDAIPVHLLYKEREALRHERDLVNTLLDDRHANEWPDGADDAVRLLCREVCDGFQQCTFFTYPEHVVRALEEGLAPPHVIVYDWEYQHPVDHNASIKRILSSTFSYLQVYTHLPAEGVEAELEPLRTQYGKRLLPTQRKSAVNPASLSLALTEAWRGTIAGELADRVRAATVTAVEKVLIDMGSVPKAALGAIAEEKGDNLVQVIMSRVREELGASEAAALTEIVKSSDYGESSEAVRRLMSLWYYWFPTDSRVRRGDIVKGASGYGLVVTPACDLAKFTKKAGRRLTWIAMESLESPPASPSLTDLGLDTCAKSLTGQYGKAGENVVILPNVPSEFRVRDKMVDLVLMCHSWSSSLIEGAADGPLLYRDAGLVRVCTVAEPFASAVIARAQSVLSAPAVPNFPRAEVTRLSEAIAAAVPSSKTTKSK